MLYKVPRFFLYFCIGVLILLSIVLLGLRYWLLPNINQYKREITDTVSHSMGMPVSIGHIYADWSGLNPHIALSEVQIFDNDKNPTLTFSNVETTISWRSLLAMEVKLSTLKIIKPSLEVRRDITGKLYVASIEIKHQEEGKGFSDLLLDTRNLFIQDASLSWRDELRGAPLLNLEKVSLHVENRGSRHRFGLVATPPPQLAKTFDIRGDLRGKTFGDWKHWSGKLYLMLPRTEGRALRDYFSLPDSFKNGRGNIRLWSEFEKSQVTSVIADLQLADTEIRLRDDLQTLELASVTGRLRYRSTDKGFEVTSENLSLVPRDQKKTGATNFFFHFEPASPKKSAKGTFKANRLYLSAWVSLMYYLPLDKAIKTKIFELAPSGTINNLSYDWSGEMLMPQKFSLKGNVEKGAIHPADKYPGLTGLSATIDASDVAGNLTITSIEQLSWSHGFDEPLLPQRFFTKLSWKRRANYTDFVINEFSYKDPHIAGSVSGTYKWIPHHPGVVDIDAKFTELDGHYIAQYLKPIMKPIGHDWLKRAIVNARGTETSLRVAGDLRKFPFADDNSGRFVFETKVDHGILNFDDAWPRIENIQGTVTLNGRGLIVKAKEGNIFGARLKDVVAKVDDLYGERSTLDIVGEASGSLNEKLRFVNQSPVKESIGPFVDGIKGAGEGRLKLKLSVPLHDAAHALINGDYEFQKAGLQFNSGLPSIENIFGHLLFSEKDIRAKNIKAQILGGPVNIDVASLPDNGVNIKASGTADTALLINYIRHPLLKRVSGRANWQGGVDLGHSSSKVNLSSSLKEVQLDFPAPLTKAKDTVAAFYFEMKKDLGKSEVIRTSIEKIFSAELDGKFSVDEKSIAWKRGLISVGKPLASYPGEGLWLQANLDTLDVDQWRSLMWTSNGADGGKVSLPIAGIDFSVRNLNVFDHKLNDIHFVATAQGNDWRGDIFSPRIDGKFLWQGGNNKRLQARLKRLYLAEMTDKESSENTANSSQDFPSLDIVADDFQMRNRKFGKLELKMIPQGKNWQIENLRITQPDSAFDASGVWHTDNSPSTSLSFKIDTANAGRLLNELNFKDVVKGASANLKGELNWPGAPYDMVLPKLSGNLKIEAKKGQFLKVQPGAGRLLGLINLQSLPRRITLDFRDVFSEGYVFDTITGDVNIQQGVMNTRNFLINGPAAKVELSGSANLAKETQQLEVKVIPSVGEGFSVATGILGGPVVGVTAYVLQKLLQDPLNRAVAYEYKVSGTWDNPTVEKVQRFSQPAQ